MARTTSSAVEGIIQVDSSIDLSGFIDTATALVDWLESKDTDGELTATQLERIECFLAAHFYAHRDQLLQSKSTGKASGSFQGQTGMFLKSTQYGQTALLLDTTGYLADMNKTADSGQRPVAGAVWLGTRYKNDSSERSEDQ